MAAETHDGTGDEKRQQRGGTRTGAVSASYPLTEHVSLAGSVTYYHTQNDVIPNVDDDFVVGSAGPAARFSLSGAAPWPPR